MKRKQSVAGDFWPKVASVFTARAILAPKVTRISQVVLLKSRFNAS